MVRKEVARSLAQRLILLSGLGFVLLLIVLLANALVIRRQLGVQIDDQSWLTHTRQILFE